MRGRAPSGRLPVLLAAAVLAAVTGCASVPKQRSHPDLLRKTGGIRTVGLLAPRIDMFEEQARFGINRTVPHDEWAPSAADAVSRAFAAEMKRVGWTLVPIGRDAAESREVAELFNAVDFSIQRHAMGKESGAMPPREPFPGKTREFDYSVGPLTGTMVRDNIDAVWIVRGFNLLPTTGAALKDGLETLAAILSAAGGGPGVAFTLKKLELRVALVDGTGRVLYYATADAGDAQSAGAADEPAAATGGPEAPAPGDDGPARSDLRDPRAAGNVVRAALSGLRKEKSP